MSIIDRTEKRRMSTAVIIKTDDIQSKIYTVRGLQVMLDKDLADYYQVKPIRLREQVKRNPKRFPPDFMFQINEDEVNYLLSQNAIPTKSSLGGYLPYVFTEQGVAAISAVLTSERAIEVNIQIMRAFVAMRHFLISNVQFFQRLDSLEMKQMQTDQKLEQIFDALGNKQLQPRQGIFFDGQVFDAFRFISDMIRSAKSSIVLIDNYIDDTVLDMLAKRKKGVTAKIYTRAVTKQMNLDLKKHNEQYAPIEIFEFKQSHDRFIIIDSDEVYHIGASIKDAGKKWFAFSKMNLEAEKIISLIEESV
jgi:hypothetical protein